MEEYQLESRQSIITLMGRSDAINMDMPHVNETSDLGFVTKNKKEKR